MVVVAVIGFGIAAYFLWNQNTTSPTTSTGGTGGLPPVTTSTVTNFPTSTTVTIGTSQGSVTMNNFYKNPALVVPGGGTILIVTTSSYSLVYTVSDSSFTIALTSEPLAAARTAAEAGLLQALGISRADACRLNVSVYVPVSIDAERAGINFGLSFCPGAAAL